MASKGPPKRPAPAERRRRPPPTIELSAREVSVDPARADVAADGASPTESAPASGPAAPAAAEYGPAEPAAASFAEPAHEEPAATQPDVQATGPAHMPPPEPPAAEPPRWEPPPEPPPRAAAPQRPSPWTLLGAGGVGGVVALAVAAILYFAGLLDSGSTGGTAQLSSQVSARLAALEAQVARRASEPPAVDTKAVQDIAARLAKLESSADAPRPATPDPGVISRLSSIDVAVKSVGDAVGNLNSRSDELAAALRAARERADATAKAIAELQAALGRQRASAADKGEIESLAGRLAALESSTRSVERKIETPGSTAADRDVRLAVLTEALKDAVERGAPYATELAAVKPLVAEQKAIAALEPFAAGGAPSDEALAAELRAIMPALAQAAAPQARGGGFLDRLQANANRLVRVRPLNEPAGDDSEAVVERIGATARRADVAGALADLARLTPAQRAPAESWIARAQARNAALAAAREIAAASYRALARPTQ